MKRPGRWAHETQSREPLFPSLPRVTMLVWPHLIRRVIRAGGCCGVNLPRRGRVEFSTFSTWNANLAVTQNESVDLGNTMLMDVRNRSRGSHEKCTLALYIYLVVLAFSSVAPLSSLLFYPWRISSHTDSLTTTSTISTIFISSCTMKFFVNLLISFLN